MDSFRKNRLGKDGTYKDFCRWYGGDCGDCFQRNLDNPPPCYEPHPENEQGHRADRKERRLIATLDLLENKMNDQLYEKAVEAITELFSDKSVSQSEAKANLESLIGEIEIMIESLGEI